MNAEVNEVTQPPISGLELSVAVDDDSNTRRPRITVTLRNTGSQTLRVGVGVTGVFTAGLAEGANAVLLEASDDKGHRLEEFPALDSPMVEHTIDSQDSVSNTFDLWNIPEAVENRPPYGTHTFVSSYEVPEDLIEGNEQIVEGSFTVTVE